MRLPNHSFAFYLITSLLVCFNLAKSQTDFWQQTNGPTGGNVRCIAIKLNDDIFAGTGDHLDGGGSIFRSIDNGDNWTQINNGIPNGCFEALAISPNGTIFVGTFGAGVFRSIDNGDSWVSSNSELSYPCILSLAINSSCHVFAGTTGGLFRSLDNGANWSQVGFFNQVRSIAISSSGIIYAGCSGIYRSTDNGNNWTFMGLRYKPIQTIKIDSSGNIYAGTYDEGIFYSTNNGASWSPINAGLSSLYISSLAINSKEELFAGTVKGVFYSKDKGKNWIGLGLDHVHSLANNSSDHIFAGSLNEGIFRSTNNGENWTLINSGLINTHVEALLIDSNNYIFAGTERNGIFRSMDTGYNWSQSNTGLTSYHVYCFSINNDGYIFAGADGGVFRSINGGNTWTKIFSTSTYYYVNSLITTSQGYIFASLIGDCAAAIYRSADNGDSWSYSTVSTRVFSSNSKGYIFASGYKGVLRSTDNGENWEVLSLGSTPDALVIGDNDKIIVIVMSSEVYRSSDNGKTWIQSHSNFPNANIFSFSINSENHIFIGTDEGIFLSMDEGDSWSQINSGLINIRVLALVINFDDYLFAGTQGGGVFRSIQSTTSIKDILYELPEMHSMDQNFPNPFNDYTLVRYELNRVCHVTFKLFNTRGQQLLCDHLGKRYAGQHVYHFRANDFPSGIYYYQLQADDFVETKKMVVIH